MCWYWLLFNSINEVIIAMRKNFFTAFNQRLPKMAKRS